MLNAMNRINLGSLQDEWRDLLESNSKLQLPTFVHA
ncbi:Hypothetical protein PP7435_CHR4-1598 [Komagataella phaffii CBS 7435]|uniref:Uncharacterized protein n=1 Tax=Komagataella phaffii (strain ATCC 76273 / CBS 7435 / CECT 11047 / NRRL Y-11430 / Wegner 21-1) TaxID=981350 RepID=A0A1G4KQX4_KOMPC|nr:Hypothetical protein BQ9382_C4-3347 [Komagataella phaffii CBS 7435]SCV12393.1 Hypothetical protein PP7435_CHR4-1598 [Komagataella phaffii CBS 7435]